MVWWREKCSQMLRQPLCGSCIPARHGRQEKSAGIIQCIHSPVSGFYLKKKRLSMSGSETTCGSSHSLKVCLICVG